MPGLGKLRMKGWKIYREEIFWGSYDEEYEFMEDADDDAFRVWAAAVTTKDKDRLIFFSEMCST